MSCYYSRFRGARRSPKGGIAADKLRAAARRRSRHVVSRRASAVRRAPHAARPAPLALFPRRLPPRLLRLLMKRPSPPPRPRSPLPPSRPLPNRPSPRNLPLRRQSSPHRKRNRLLLPLLAHRLRHQRRLRRRSPNRRTRHSLPMRNLLRRPFWNLDRNRYPCRKTKLNRRSTAGATRRRLQDARRRSTGVRVPWCCVRCRGRSSAVRCRAVRGR